VGNRRFCDLLPNGSRMYLTPESFRDLRSNNESERKLFHFSFHRHPAYFDGSVGFLSVFSVSRSNSPCCINQPSPATCRRDQHRDHISGNMSLVSV
jgi:hypothetical protein